MSDLAHSDIVQQLIDNTAEVLAAGTHSSPEELSALANRQKALVQMWKKSVLDAAPGISRSSINTLQDLVARATDTVRAQMGRNRGIMQATGIKKKVLQAYGTVTVTDNSSR